MRITDLDIIITAPPAPGWGGRYWILVKLTTNTKVVGWGECYASSVGPAAMTAIIEDVFQRYFLDQSPENIEILPIQAQNYINTIKDRFFVDKYMNFL